MSIQEEQQDNNIKKTKIKKKRIKGNYTSKYFSPYCFHRLKKQFPGYTINQIHQALTLYFELAREDLSLGNKVNFLNKLGALYITKQKREVKYDIQTGKITNEMPINIGETVKLWKQKPELKQKTFVYYTNDHSDGYLFNLHYQISKAVYKNKNVYTFQFNRGLKVELSDNIFDKKVDAYLVTRNEIKQQK
jgi:hypothetical protein